MTAICHQCSPAGECQARIPCRSTQEAITEIVARAIFEEMRSTRPLLPQDFRDATTYTQSACYRYAGAARRAIEKELDRHDR